MWFSGVYNLTFKFVIKYVHTILCCKRRRNLIQFKIKYNNIIMEMKHFKLTTSLLAKDTGLAKHNVP